MHSQSRTHSLPQIPSGPQLNALKHGMYAETILLPGEDAPQFRAMRRRLFHDYQPRTLDEAQCVEGMAASLWRIWRWRRWEAGFGRQVDSLIHADADGHLCRPEPPHQWQHDTKDCSIEEARLRRLLSRDRADLFELQRTRRHRLIDGAIHVAADYQEFLGEEAEEFTESTVGTSGSAPASDSSDAPIGKIWERKADRAISPALARVLSAREARKRRKQLRREERRLGAGEGRALEKRQSV